MREALIKSENPTWQDLAEGWGEPIKLQIPRSQNQGPEEDSQPARVARDDNSEGRSTGKEANDDVPKPGMQNSTRNIA